MLMIGRTSIDPYLDENSGPRLLEVSVNATAAASSFGASRLYLPKETFAEIFAWEEVIDYIQSATAPIEQDGRITGVNAGDAADRASIAESRVSNLLALFQDLLEKLRGRDEKSHEDYARNALGPEQIVKKWADGPVRYLMTYDEESKLLAVPLHSPALLFERVTRAAGGEIVEFTSSTYRGDRYRLVSELGVGGRPAVPMGLASRAIDGFA